LSRIVERSKNACCHQRGAAPVDEIEKRMKIDSFLGRQCRRCLVIKPREVKPGFTPCDDTGANLRVGFGLGGTVAHTY
jgi:hypothetical protein